MKTQTRVSRPLLLEVAAVSVTFGFLGRFRRRLDGSHIESIWVAGHEASGFGITSRLESDKHWSISRSFFSVSDTVAFAEISWFIFCKRPSVIHVHTPKAAVIVALSNALLGRSHLIFQVHGFLSDSNKLALKIFGWFSEFFTCCLADEIWPVALWMSEKLHKSSCLSKVQVFLPAKGSAGGVDIAVRFNPSRFSESVKCSLRKKYGIFEGNFVIGFVGRFGQEKGSIELGEVWTNVKKRIPGIRLVLVGNVEPRFKSDAKLFQSFKEDPQVTIVEWTSRVEEIYAVLDLLVFPSRREGLPYSLIEACAMGIPVVATDIPGSSEVLEGARDFGRIVGLGDVVAMSDAIVEYAKNEEMRFREGILGRKSVELRYSDQVVSEAMFNRICRIVESSREVII